MQYASCITTMIFQMSIGNYGQLVGYLKYKEQEDDILKWSLVAAGAVLLIILVAAGLVFIYRRGRSARRFQDDQFKYLSQKWNRSRKIRTTGRVYGVGLQGTRAAFRDGYITTNLPRGRFDRPRQESDPRRGRIPRDDDYLSAVGRSTGTYVPSHVGGLNTEYLKPKSNFGSEHHKGADASRQMGHLRAEYLKPRSHVGSSHDPRRPGVYILPR